MHTNDRTLLLKTHAGDERAARELWARHAARLRAYAHSVLPVWLSADDAVQNVMCRVLQTDRGVLKKVEDPAAWLVRSVRNEALMMMRGARRERARRAGAVTGDARPQMQRAMSVDGLEQALAGLPRRLREVVVLRHVAGLTFDQAAMALDANRNTVAWRYREAVALLRKMLGAGGDIVAGAANREVSHA